MRDLKFFLVDNGKAGFRLVQYSYGKDGARIERYCLVSLDDIGYRLHALGIDNMVTPEDGVAVIRFYGDAKSVTLLDAILSV